MIKKTILRDFPGPSAKTFQAVKVTAGDTLRWVRLTTGQDEILMVSRLGMAIRFSEKDVRPMGLVATGVNGMKLGGSEDRIVAMEVIKPRGDVFLISDRGLAKRCAQNQYPVQGRYGKGVLAWKSGENVRLVGAAIGLAEQRATAFLQRAAARSVRIGDAVRRNRVAVGNPLFPVKENDQVRLLSPVIPVPNLPGPTKTRTTKKRTTSKGSSTSSKKRTAPTKRASSTSAKSKTQPKRRSSKTKTPTTRRKTSPSQSSKGSRRSKGTAKK
jgi:DNA gyrase/topoisomerase IV subunit A